MVTVERLVPLPERGRRRRSRVGRAAGAGDHCLGCGRDVRDDDDVVWLDGLAFHRRCTVYRDQPRFSRPSRA
jgi:hypothetical protein